MNRKKRSNNANNSKSRIPAIAQLLQLLYVRPEHLPETTMPTFVQLCQGLLSKLEQEYQNNESTIQVDTTPDKFFLDYEMALFAQSRQGTKSVNMMIPQLN